MTDKPTGVILLVRTEVDDLPPAARSAFVAAFPGYNVKFTFVNPMRPEELDEMTRAPGVLAVFLQPDPLPRIVMQKKETPCIAFIGGELTHIKGLELIAEPFKP